MTLDPGSHWTLDLDLTGPWTWISQDPGPGSHWTPGREPWAYLLGPPADCTICVLRLPTMTSVSAHVSASELGPVYGVAHWMLYVHEVLLGPVLPPVVWQTLVTPEGGEAAAVPEEVPAGTCTTGSSRQ